MLHWLKRHPFPVVAHFDFSLVLTYALPASVLSPLLPPGLILDTREGLGFLAIALVQTRRLRPLGFPAFAGRDFFLTGYRIFTRFQTKAGRTLRGLRILRSDADSAFMVRMGNLLTHYHYHRARAQITRTESTLDVRIETPRAEADLHVQARLSGEPAAPPAGSPFPDWHAARQFAGPLPFTFDYERETHSIVRIEGVRSQWKPRPVEVEIRRAAFLEREPFASAAPVLANAFLVENVPYRWQRGVREELAS